MGYSSKGHKELDKMKELIAQYPKLPNCFCCCLVCQSKPSFATPMVYSPPDSSVHGISQARLLEWVAIYNSIQKHKKLTTTKKKP